MRRMLLLAGCALVAATCLAPDIAAAQEQVGDEPDRTRVERSIGKEVTVTTKDGRTLRGRLLRVSETAIQLSLGGRLVQVVWADIRQVTIRLPGISIKKSTLLGLSLGVGVGALALPLGACTEDAGTFALECLGFFGGIGAGAGALTGVIINSGRPPHVVYRADRPHLILAPVVSSHRAGIIGAFRW